MLLVALDPAQFTGVAYRMGNRIFHRTINVRPKKTSETYGKRYHRFYYALWDLFENLIQCDPEVAVVYERSQFLQGIEATRNSFGFEAVICLVCEEFQIPYFYARPKEWKAFHGDGNMSKQAAMRLAKELTGEAMPEDEAEAALIYYWGMAHLPENLFKKPTTKRRK